jgi:hypothetical protein
MTAVEWLSNRAYELFEKYSEGKIDRITLNKLMVEATEKAKEMEKEQIGYTKQDVIKAGEMGEINYLDTLHIVTYLDEAKQFNETYGGNK